MFWLSWDWLLSTTSSFSFSRNNIAKGSSVVSETYPRYIYPRYTRDIPEVYLRCTWGAASHQRYEYEVLSASSCLWLAPGAAGDWNSGIMDSPGAPRFPSSTLPYRYTTCVLTTLGISRPLTFAGVPHYPAPPVLSTRLYIPSILHPRPDPHQSVLAHIPHPIPYLPKSHSGKLYLNMYEYSSLG